ncbi:hypothetical protein [Halosimplex amylolyticum]|uniref:hypothetical protein n=1 Tax=Halosimplex amylolyticum TaxID=3396616 RepID=UPI003F55330A
MRRSLAVLLVALLVAPSLASIGAAAPEDPSNYTLAELSERGQQIEGGSADPSRRWLGERGNVFVSYEQTNLVKEMASQRPEWAVDKVVEPDKTVDTKEVRMHFNRLRGADVKKIHVTVVAWKTETKTVNGTDGTPRDVEYPTAIRRQTTEVRLSGPVKTAEIDLTDTEEPQTITMYIQEYPGARWVFPHDPVALSDSVPFGTSWGSYLSWFFGRFFIIAALGVPIAIAGAYKTLDYTYTGPGKGVMWWVIAGGLASYLSLYFSHRSIALMLTSAPWIMGLFIVVVAYIATLELADPTETGLFEGIITTDATNPMGDDIPDIADERGDTIDYVDDGDGTIKLVKPSLGYFGTLLAGAEAPELDTADLKTRVKYHGSAAGDEKFYADVSDTDDGEKPVLVEVEWPALEFGPSGLKQRVESDEGVEVLDEWDKDRLVRTGLFGALAGALGNVLIGGVGWALLAFTVGAYLSTVRRVDGSASFDPAPVHSTAAKARAVTERQELTIASTFSELQETIANADSDTAEKAVDIAEAHISQFRDQIDRLLGGEDSGGLPESGTNDVDTDINPQAGPGVSDD